MASPYTDGSQFKKNTSLGVGKEDMTNKGPKKVITSQLSVKKAKRRWEVRRLLRYFSTVLSSYFWKGRKTWINPVASLAFIFLLWSPILKVVQLSSIFPVALWWIKSFLYGHYGNNCVSYFFQGLGGHFCFSQTSWIHWPFAWACTDVQWVNFWCWGLKITSRIAIFLTWFPRKSHDFIYRPLY